MANREQPYDPYIPSGSAGQPQGGNAQYEGGNPRTAAIQSVCLQLHKIMEEAMAKGLAKAMCSKQEICPGLVRSACPQSQALARFERGKHLRQHTMSLLCYLWS